MKWYCFTWPEAIFSKTCAGVSGPENSYSPAFSLGPSFSRLSQAAARLSLETIFASAASLATPLGPVPGGISTSLASGEPKASAANASSRCSAT